MNRRLFLNLLSLVPFTGLKSNYTHSYICKLENITTSHISNSYGAWIGEISFYHAVFYFKSEKWRDYYRSRSLKGLIPDVEKGYERISTDTVYGHYDPPPVVEYPWHLTVRITDECRY